MIPIRRNIEHTVEWHYGRQFSQTHLLQYKLLTYKQLSKNINDPVHLTASIDFFDEKDDLYGMYEVEDSFEFMKYSGFYNFFITNRVDVPRFFRKTRSVKRKVNELLLLKFNNYLMRHGKRYKCLKMLHSIMFALHHEYKSLRDLTYDSVSAWREIFMIYDSVRLSSAYSQPSFSKSEVITYGNRQHPLYKDLLTPWNYSNIFFRNLTKMLPVFSFYIYKVDKQIFKNTRGRSGKYTFIWKYVTPYKRSHVVMFWLMRELRVSPGRSIHERLLTMLRIFIFAPQKTWMWRVKQFSANYVYLNCRRTLAEHYRTTTK